MLFFNDNLLFILYIEKNIFNAILPRHCSGSISLPCKLPNDSYIYQQLALRLLLIQIFLVIKLLVSGYSINHLSTVTTFLLGISLTYSERHTV